MASYIFDQVKTWVATTKFSFVDSNSVFKLALMDNTLLDNSNSSKTKWSEVKQYEITKSTQGLNTQAYTQAPLINLGSAQVVDNKTSQCDDGLPDTIIYADDVIYPVSTIDSYCVVITRTVTGGSAPETGSIISDDDELVTVLVLKTDSSKMSSNQGVFTVKLSSGSGGYLILK